MKLDLNILFNQNEIEIDKEFNIEKSVYQKTEIKDLPKLKAKGFIDKHHNIKLDIEGIMVIEDARTLDDVNYPFNFQIEEKIDENSHYYDKKSNMLDIIELLWENIVLEIPIRITKNEDDQLSLKGEGWELINDPKKTSVDARLAPLKDLLEKGKE